MRRSIPTACECCPRRGMTLLEVVVAATILGTLIAAIIPVLSRTNHIRQQVDRREVALEAISNLLERASRESRVSAESLQTLAQGLVPDGQLPSAEWKFEIDSDSPNPLRRVIASLSWQAPGSPRRSVSLARWFGEEKP